MYSGIIADASMVAIGSGNGLSECQLELQKYKKELDDEMAAAEEAGKSREYVNNLKIKLNELLSKHPTLGH